MREGEIWANRQGYEITILKYNNSLNCDIQFNDNKSTILECVQYGNIKRGNINNPFHPSVYGVGFIGNGRYNSKIKGKSTKTYKTWSGILERCYSEKYQSKNPTYKNTTICEEWKCFQVFAQWFEENYNPEVMEGWDLDKDIICTDCKIYSPETCCFVPHEINSVMLQCSKTQGKYPTGVSLHKNMKKFMSQLSKKGKKLNLGYFETEQEAFQVYKDVKESYIKELAEKYKNNITERCYNTLVNYVVTDIRKINIWN